MKNIFVFPSWSRFPVKFFCRFAFRSASRACCLLKSISIILQCLSIRDSLVNNYLCNHLPDHSQFFECYHMFLNCFYRLIKKKTQKLSIDHNIVILYTHFWKNILCVLSQLHYLQKVYNFCFMIKQKVYL